MTLEIVLVLSILTVAIVFLITEWIPMEVTVLLVLGIAALTGLVSPVEALSGFSNPAVVTIWGSHQPEESTFFNQKILSVLDTKT